MAEEAPVLALVLPRDAVTQPLDPGAKFYHSRPQLTSSPSETELDFDKEHEVLSILYPHVESRETLIKDLKELLETHTNFVAAYDTFVKEDEPTVSRSSDEVPVHKLPPVPRKLLCLWGKLELNTPGNFVPLQVFFPKKYPADEPIIFVRPERANIFEGLDFVEPNGRIHLRKILFDWGDDPSLLTLLNVLRGLFSERLALPPSIANTYFARRPTEKKKIAVIIPFYNEDPISMFKSLISLKECIEDVDKQYQGRNQYHFSFCLIQDGWNKAHPEMRQYLKDLFPNSTSWAELDDENVDKQQPHVTYIFENVLADGSAGMVDVHVPEGFGEYEANIFNNGFSYLLSGLSKPKAVYNDKSVGSFKLDISLIVKKDNRKKHNSHEWFLSENGFCGAIDPDYMFCTDCSTLFATDCLTRLIKMMEKEPKCAVSTGRQVVMSPVQQGSNDNFTEMIYRSAQCYDFESSFSTFMGAFAVFGFLPVVPGPCGMYRWSHMRGKPLEWYFEIVNKPLHKCDAILSNLKIAEDRILSYAAVLKTPCVTKMCIAPEAEFYFEAETEIKNFITQRRRWINGTFAGYVYFLLNFFELFMDCKLPYYKIAGVLFLIICQLLIYLIVFITPGIFLSALYSLIFYLSDVLELNPVMPVLIWIAILLLYLSFVIAHTRNILIGWLVIMLLLIGGFTTYSSLLFSIIYLSKSFFVETSITTALLVTYVVMFAPIIISLHHPKSTIRMLVTVLPFYFFLPMLVAFFGAYSVARFWDISWGNRPEDKGTDPAKAATASSIDQGVSLILGEGGSAVSMSEEQRNKLAAKLEKRKKEKEVMDNLEKRKKAAADRSKKDTIEEERKAKEKLEYKAQTFCAVVISFNLLFLFAYTAFTTNPIVLAFVCCVLFLFTALQMIISFVYFLLNYLVEKLVVNGLAHVVGYFRKNIESPQGPLSPSQHLEYEALGETGELNQATGVILVDKIERSFWGEFDGAGSAILLVSTNFAINYFYLAITTFGQEVLIELDTPYYDLVPYLSLAYPIAGLIQILVGWAGDVQGSKAHLFFKTVLVMTVLSFVTFTTISEVYIWYLDSRNPHIEFWWIYGQSILQMFILNIMAASSFVLILKYSTPKNVLKAIVWKSILEISGQSVASLVGLFYYQYSIKTTRVIVNGVGCIMMLLLMPIQIFKVRSTPPDPPVWVEACSPQEGNRRLAIIFAGFFCAMVAYTPFAFGMDLLFAEYMTSTDAGYAANIVGIIIESTEFIVSIAILLVSYFYGDIMKTCALLLSFCALPQLLFVFTFPNEEAPWSGADVSVMILTMICGLTRSLFDTVYFYLFARDIEGNTKRTGFWVSSMNTILISAEVLGQCICLAYYYWFGWQFRFAVVTCGFFGVFGIACAFKLRPSAKIVDDRLQAIANQNKRSPNSSSRSTPSHRLSPSSHTPYDSDVSAAAHSVIEAEFGSLYDPIVSPESHSLLEADYVSLYDSDAAIDDLKPKKGLRSYQ